MAVPQDYQRHIWQVADPITQEKMNNIEEGLDDTNEAVRTLWSQDLDNRITTQGQTISGLSELVEETKGIAITASALSTDVAYSKGQIEAALIRENNTSGQDNYNNLAAHFHEIHEVDGQLSTSISNIENAIRAAYNAGGSVTDNGSSRPSQSLAETMAEHYSKIIEALERSSGIYTNLYPAGQRSIFDRLNAIDNNQAPGMTLINVITELQAARGDASNLTLDDRLDAMDTLISGKVNYSDVVDGLESNASNRPLSANQGRLIKLALGGDFDSTNTVNAAINAAEAATKAYTDTQNTVNKVSEIISAHRNDVENDTLDNRFDDAEAAILQNASNISTINNNITTIATELGMVSNDEITGSSSRIDIIQSNLTTATENIGTLQSGLATTTATANAAATQTDLTALTGRVTTLEGKHETVVYDAPQSGSNYSEGIPNISNPSTDLNYLIQDNEGKYYYWRYFGAVTGWQLIGGAGEGSGTGTSSGVIVPQLPNAESANENTDYFVGNNEDGYLHYRFNEVNNELVPILIGVNFSDVKRYNMEKVILNEKPYLRLYEFKQGTGNTILVDDSNTIADWVASTSYTVGDKVLHDEYYYSCKTANNDSEWNIGKWDILDENMRVITTIELPQGGGGGSTTGLNVRLVRIPPIGSTVIKGNDVYIRFFYSAIDTEEGSRIGHYVLKSQTGITLTEGDIESGASSADATVWPSGMQDGTFENGYGSINVKNYCVLGTNKFTLSVTPMNDNARTREWTINTVELKLTSNAPQTQIISTSESVDISYIPQGGITNKKLIVKIDGVEQSELETTVNSTGSELVCTIPPQSVGAHRIELALKATINGREETSKESVIRDYIWYDANSSIILSSPYRGQTITTTQYSEIEIPYSVYDANNLSPTVKYYYDYVNSSSIPFDEVTLSNTNEGILKTTVNESGLHNVTIQVEDTILTFNLNVTNLNITISPTPGAIIDFNPANYTNNSMHRLPTWQVGNNTYELAVSENFNWSTKWTGDNQDTGGGYREDEDGKCFVIKAGTYATINYKMFKQNNTIQPNGGVSTTSAVFDDGAEMKIIFKVAAVRDASAIWFSNVGHATTNNDDDTPIGIQLQAHEGWLKTNKASNTAEENVALPEGYVAWSKTSAYNIGDVVVYKSIIYKCIKAIAAPALGAENSWNKKSWQSLGQIETEISATNSYLYFPYSEEDKIELDININKQGNQEDFAMSYEDGVPSKAYPYSYSSGGDILYHAIGEEAGITIGSPNCDVYIYRLRIYNKSLTTEQILRNFIADGKNIDERINRYRRNSIYYNSAMVDVAEEDKFTPYASEGVLDPYHLAARMPNVKILMLDTPKFTVGKKDFVKGSTLRCIQASGGEVYPGTDADNWFFSNGYHAGQGTTSDNYGQSARNVDFLFECDGVHYPTKSDNLSDFTEGYQSFVAKGNNASNYDEQTQTWSIASDNVKELCLDWKDDDTWESGISYTIGDLIRYNKLVYKCKADHTSDSSFDTTKWDQLDEDYGCKISLTHDTTTGADTSIPNNYFNFKANVASSENVNNALFQKRYNDFLPYDSPAKLRDSRIKNDMEFVPAILFVRERGYDINGNAVTRTEFTDGDWHFYALGNLGDSKKTDYTRAYDPDDMNEFTIEISDNNTANSQFQSGVFLSTERYIVANPITANLSQYEEAQGPVTPDSTIPNAYNGTFVPTTDTVINQKTYYYRKETVETDEIADNPNVDQDPMKYIYPITSEQWNAKNDGEYINHRHKMLSTEPFDGDHSFEFRYACKGDYRDGDFINDTNGISTVPNTDPETVATKPYLTNDEVQEGLNRQVWEAFYEWVVTSTEEQFRNEAAQWFVPEAIEFFYAFTHYYTMMDNRAKNTFWHFAKTGKYRKVSRPVAALFHIYETSSNAVADNNGVYTGTFVPAIGDFSPSNEYYTQYAFDLWTYDTDTACGIDNNGELSFPYGKEDMDYRIAGQPASGWAFNGSGSIFWRRLSTTFENDIATLMRKESDDCFSTAEHLINEFDRFQECFPEEIWRRDIERKYIRTFTGNSYDHSITTNKQNVRFLRAMMQGRKKYQRRQWVRNQAIYFGSKYGLNNVHTSEHTIEFVTYTPSVAEGQSALPVPANQSDLILTPYQDMYIDVGTGNSITNLDLSRLQRAKAGERVHVDCRSGGGAQETRIYIFGGEYISAMENLAPFYPYSGEYGRGKRLQVLNLGSENSEYNNPKFTALNINKNMPLLDTLNIKNCKALSGSIDLSQSGNLRVVEAEGSSITGIGLPAYTAIETLHLPTTVTDIALTYARALTDFAIINSTTREEDYSNVTILNITDSDYSSTVNWLDIAKETLDNRINTLYLYDLKTSSVNDIDELEDFVTKKHQLEVNYDAQGNLITRLILSGIIHVNGEWSEAEIETYKSIWSTPELDFNTDNGTYKERYRVVYKYPDRVVSGTTIVGETIYSTYVDKNDPLVDIYYNSIITDKPALAPTADTVYSFGTYQQGLYKEYSGWKISDENTSLDQSATRTVTRNLVLEARFVSSARLYTVRWFLDRNNTRLIKSSIANIPYGGGHELEAPTILDIHTAGYETAVVNISGNIATYDIFNGWEKLPININPDGQTDYYDIYANWIHGSDTIDNIFADTTNLSPIQLLVLSAITDKSTLSNKIVTGSQASYTLGSDNNQENGQLLIGPGASRTIWNSNLGQSSFNTGIKPFNSTNGFTLAIDYCFNADATYAGNPAAAALIGCYYQNNQQAEIANGFALYDSFTNTTGPRVGFGKMFEDSQQAHSVGVGNSSVKGNRNILVLRHPKDSSTIQVYSGLINNNIVTNITQQTLTWNNDSMDIDLIVGAITRSNDAAYTTLKSTVVDAKGTIYWMKYWPEDLGLGECKRLAAWPHENMTFAIQNLINGPTSDARTASSNAPTTTVTLTTINSSAHGNVTQGIDSSSLAEGTIVGWPSGSTVSLVRAIYNNRLILGLPQNLASIICKKSVLSKEATVVRSSQYSTNYFQSNTNYSSSRDYIYAMSIADIASSLYENKFSNELALNETSIPWLNTSNVSFYQYNQNTTTKWDLIDNPTDWLYLIARFPMIKTPIQLRVFQEPVLDTGNSYYSDISQIGSIQEYDIIQTADNCYMYVSSATVINSGIQVMPNEGKFECTASADGGWVKATSYWLRTFNPVNTSYSRCSFMNISYGGTVKYNASVSTLTLGLNYSFSI